MLQTIVHILIISAVCLIWGMPLALKQQRTTSGLPVISPIVLIHAFFTGLVIIAILSSWLSLFVPLQFDLLLRITLAVLAVELIYFFRSKMSRDVLISFEKKNLNRVQWLFIIGCIALFIILGSGKAAMDDTDIYHIQVIKWNNEYRAIPGLANLYLRFGFCSNWFHLASFFYIPAFKSQNYLALNSTLSIWFFIFLVCKWKQYTSSETPKSKILAIFYLLSILYMLAEWDLLRGNSSSTSYDFIVTALTFITISTIVENILFPLRRNNNPYILIILALAIPTFKLSGGPALLLLLLYFIINKLSFKKYMATAMAAIVILCPLLYKNYLQTGYFLFPYTQFNFLHPDWQVPSQLVNRFYSFISLSNKYINQSIPAEGWRNPSSFNWILIWLKNLTLNDKLIVGLSMLSMPLSYAAFKRLKDGRARIISLYITCLVILLAWLFSAPDPRFVYAYLLFVAFFPGCILIGPFVKKWHAGLGLLFFSAVIVLYGFRKLQPLLNEKSLLSTTGTLMPPFNRVVINNVSYNIPGLLNDNWNIRCYAVPLPCICQLNPYLEKRGKDYTDGFRMNKVPDPDFVSHYNY